MKITVFLVDDHAVLRDGLRLLLEANPEITVVGEADNGREAIERIGQLRPEIIIMDLAMPQMNGIEATRALAKTQPSAKVIILSMHSTTEHIVSALDAGAQGYLLKESVGAEVLDAVAAVRRGLFYWSKKIPEKVVLDCKLRASKSDAPTPLMSLSRREREILQLVVEGRSSAEIAQALNLSPKTVDTYRSRLMHKLDIADVPALVKFAVQFGLTPLQ
ncbi:MAG: response regulator transcription factor [Nitrospiraceae bacterium]|nr:response regulator transcription factor [Nitrospiraceae bacterium]